MKNENPLDLCLSVLRRLQSEGILKHVVLIGSWCMHFYRGYFENPEALSLLRTRDIDFAFPLPTRIERSTDLAEVLKTLGFVLDFSPQGYMRFGHPDLLIDFLVPERGRPSEHPFKIEKLGINAQPLRFLDFLIHGSITLRYEDLELQLPHPVRFGLHKLLISERRQNKEKRPRDRAQGVAVLRAVGSNKMDHLVPAVFLELSTKSQKAVRDALRLEDAGELGKMLIVP